MFLEEDGRIDIVFLENLFGGPLLIEGIMFDFINRI